MGLVACLKVVFDSGARGWSEVGLAAPPGQKKLETYMDMDGCSKHNCNGDLGLTNAQQR